MTKSSGVRVALTIFQLGVAAPLTGIALAHLSERFPAVPLLLWLAAGVLLMFALAALLVAGEKAIIRQGRGPTEPEGRSA